MNDEDQNSEIAVEQDRIAVEKKVMAALLLLMGSAEEQTIAAAAAGTALIPTARNVIKGNRSIHQPGFAPTLAWGMTAAWLIGQMRLLADFQQVANQRAIPIIGTRNTILRTADLTQLPPWIENVAGGSREIEARHIRNLQIAENQVDIMLPGLENRLAVLQVAPPAPGQPIPVNGVGGQHIANDVQDAQETIREAFDDSGLSPDKPFTAETTIEANTMFHYEKGAEQAEESPQISRRLWGYYYATIDDNRRTILCTTLNGTTLPKEDPFWETFTPPCHFGCRSWLRRIWLTDVSTGPKIVVPRWTDDQRNAFAQQKVNFLRYMGGVWD